MIFFRQHSSERGDTIVEVLIAIAVITLVLGGAYVTTNKSLQNTRGAQERATALKFAESQFEQLKNVIATNPSKVFPSGGPVPPTTFCITGGVNVYDATVAPQNQNCTLDVNGAVATSSSPQPLFMLKTTRSGNTFTIAETWIDISGKTTDRLQLSYRIYQ